MNLTRWILAAIMIDLVFLPMFHLAGIPVKLSYVLILVMLVTNVRLGYVSLDRVTKNLIIILCGLAIVLALGHLTFLLIFGGDTHANTLRMIVIYVMSSLALITGNSVAPGKHNYLIFLVLIYATATLTISIFHENLGSITRFYGLEYQSYFEFRKPGLFFNPNVSALSMTLLYLSIVVGEKYGYIKISAAVKFLLFLVSLATIVVLLSRNQIIAMFLITILATLSKINGKRIVVAAMFFLTLVVFIGTLRGGIDDLAYDVIGYRPVSNLVSGFSSFTDYSQPAGSLLRPLLQLDEAVQRAVKSPIIGTGADIIDRHPFKRISYHNDWLFVLVSSGFVGLILFAAFFYQICRVDLMLAIPFLLPGLTNSLIHAPSHLFFLMLLIGMTSKYKYSNFVQRETI